MTPHCGPSRESYDRLSKNHCNKYPINISKEKSKKPKRTNMNVAINGLGRIGKSVLLNLLKQKLININLINDLNPDINNICYLINYDSTYGKLSNKAVKIKNNLLKIGNREIKYFSKENIDEIDLNNIDVLIDCTGRDWSTKSIKNLKKKSNT